MKFFKCTLVACLFISCIDLGLKSSQRFPEFDFASINEIVLMPKGGKSKKLSGEAVEYISTQFGNDDCYLMDQEKLDDFYEDELGSLVFINDTDTLNLVIKSSDTYKDRVIATFTTTEFSVNSNVETTSYHRFYIKFECYDYIVKSNGED
ncbi:hypothetical protein [Nonlabens antarcticus]|uniref:hypothetical protein n=1 Tax=Nonlabens antarcticus TaxID=392714 RepID=UPI001891BEF2|nr:hypothetical protein [Nonlabens antarcticus]